MREEAVTPAQRCQLAAQPVLSHLSAAFAAVPSRLLNGKADPTGKHNMAATREQVCYTCIAMPVSCPSRPAFRR